MINPVRRSNSQQLNVMTQYGTLQPISTNQQNLDRSGWLGGRITAGKQFNVKLILPQIRKLSYLLFLNLVHQCLCDCLHLGRVIRRERRPEGV